MCRIHIEIEQPFNVGIKFKKANVASNLFDAFLVVDKFDTTFAFQASRIISKPAYCSISLNILVMPCFLN